jgi:hypothetical protein
VRDVLGLDAVPAEEVQLYSQQNRYEQFLVPMIKEVQVKTQDRANSSMMKLQQDESENDRSMIS